MPSVSRAAFLGAVCVLLLSSSLSAEERAARTKLPYSALFPGGSIADPFPFIGTDLNPAGIAMVAGLQGALYGGNQVQGGGVAGALFSRIHIGFGLDHLMPAEGVAGWRTNLNVGVTVDERILLGLQWQRTFGSDVMAGKDAIALGLLLRPFYWLSFGISAYNLSEEVVDYADRDCVMTRDTGLVQFGAGFAIRPGTDRITLGMDLVTDRRGNFWDPSAYVSVKVVDGIRLAANGWLAQVDADWQWGLGGMLVVSTPAGDLFGGYKTSGGSVHDYFSGVRLTAVPEKTILSHGHHFISFAMPAVGQEEKVGGLLSPAQPTLLETRRMLARIADDPKVDGVFFSISSLSMGWAQAQELAESVKLLRKSGKRVVAYIISGGNKAYYVASYANHIVANPAMVLQLTGIFHTRYFLADVLKSIGVEVQSVRIGKYKTYPEQFTRNEPSPAHLEAQKTMMEDFYGQLVSGIAEARKREPGVVEKWIDSGPFTARTAREMGLVDHVASVTDVTAILEHFGIRNVSLSRAYPVIKTRSDAWGPEPRIAVLLVEGSLVDGSSWKVPLLGYKFCGANNIRNAIKQIGADPSIKGVLLRIDSGGGSALASELLHQAVKSLATRKPVVVSIANSAASGGYYIAVGSNDIFLMPGSVTGSIGIWFAKIIVSELLDRLKIHRVHLEKGKSAGLLSYDRKLSEEELKMALQRLQDLYDLFLQRVSENRKLTKEEVDKLARGRVWSGERALKHKLADRFGGSYEALLHLKEKAGLKRKEPVELVYFPEKSLTRKLTHAILGLEDDTGVDVRMNSTRIIDFISYLSQTCSWAWNPWL